MSKLTKTVTIEAAPDSVLGYIADVRNHPAFIGPLKSVTNLSGDPSGKGTSWDWVYDLSGVQLSGRAEAVEYVKGKHYRYKTTSGVTSTFTYGVAAEGKGTKLTLDVEYDIPASALGKLSQSVVEPFNDKEGTKALQNLKTILED